jgi:toxin FitB
VSYLLDTCVISEMVKPRPARAVVSWLSGADEETLFLSVITLGELEKGIAKLADAKRSAKLAHWVRVDLADRFAGRTIPIDEAVATRWGTLAGESERRGVPLPVIDALLAASALCHGLTVVTRNTTDLERCGVRCLDPWLA